MNQYYSRITEDEAHDSQYGLCIKVVVDVCNKR